MIISFSMIINIRELDDKNHRLHLPMQDMLLHWRSSITHIEEYFHKNNATSEWWSPAHRAKIFVNINLYFIISIYTILHIVLAIFRCFCTSYYSFITARILGSHEQPIAADFLFHYLYLHSFWTAHMMYGVLVIFIENEIHILKKFLFRKLRNLLGKI